MGISCGKKEIDKEKFTLIKKIQIMKKVILRRLLTLALIGGGSFFGGLQLKPTSQMEESNIRVVVDAGHGSIIDKTYQTAGKQSPEWDDSLKIYEGVSVKQLSYMLVNELVCNDIDAQILNPELEDISLKERARRVNEIYEKDKRTILISLHHNAAPYNETADFKDAKGLYGWKKGGASGLLFFVFNKKTQSYEIAKIMEETTRGVVEMPTGIRIANFYILRKTKSPAVLVEYGFMTTYGDCETISNVVKRQEFIKLIAFSLKKYNEKLAK